MSPHRTIVVAVTAVATLISSVVTVSAAVGAGATARTNTLVFTVIQYNPSGPDRPTTNRQLDREWVTIRNTADVTRQLTGLEVHDAQHHRYTFGALQLKPGASIKLHTGSGRNTRADVYWGSGNYIWNNDGDTATLATGSGKVLDTCSWRDGGSGSITC